MKAKDLMIGDWVDIYHELPDESGFYKPLQVTGIHSNDGICFGHSVIESPWIDPEEFDAIEPIPLTKEILLKNGFVKVFLESAYKLPDYRSDIWFSPSTDYFYFGFDDTAAQFNCQYVHELQHALKLCRIEKEIVL